MKKLGKLGKYWHDGSGVTLVELMVTTAILSIGVLAAMASFQYISTSIQNSKARTLSNNLAQEQIEKLKNLSYYMLLVTTSTYTDTRFTPNLNYDTGNYPAQTVYEGGIAFTRATRVDFAFQNGTAITTAPYTSNDTGLKLITTYVIWRDLSEIHYQEMRNLMANPAANPLNASFSGTVRDTASNPVSGALVQVVDNSNWFGITNSAGQYQFNVSEGSYTLTASSYSFFSQTTPAYQSISSGQNITVNFNLAKMSSGTVSGYIYRNDHLVISQVVATTGTASDIEYVELYNPTTAPINIGTNASPNTPNIVPYFWDHNGNAQPRRLFYISTFTPTNGYYLISNTYNGTTCSPFTVMGITITPDGCLRYVSSPSHAIEQDEAGGVGIGTLDAVLSGFSGFNSSGWPTARIDSVAWAKNAGGHSAPAEAREGTPLGNGGSSQGIQPNEQYVRMSLPGSLSSGVGRAYDANNNNTDFFDFPTLIYPPYKSTNIQAPQSGTPATGAVISFNDPLSSAANCIDTYIASTYRACSFTTPNVATGTYTATIASGTYYLETTPVVMTAGATVNIPNATTVPAWPAAGVNNSLLNNTTAYAFVSGVVTNIYGTPLANILMGAGGRTTLTSTAGRYFLGISTGDVVLTANYNNNNRAYTSQSSSLYNLDAGSLTDNPSGSNTTWFTLSLGGILSGYFQTGSNTPIPGRVAVALSGGNQAGQGVSGNDGHFYITNLTTGTYTIDPSLDPAETSTPESVTVTLSSTGTATAVSTFTITNGLSEITGQVLLSSTAIKTGVLVIASTVTLTGGSTSPPPSISGASSILCNPCSYGASSDSAGLYSLNVRSSATSYKLYGWYTTFSGATPTVNRSGPYTVNVSTAGQIISQNLVW
jgi:prepilin-type N-terminal cleavage/methylation domain-containing protein